MHAIYSLGCKTLLQIMTLTSTCQSLLLILGLFFTGELVEGPGCSIGVQGRELLRFQLLLDAVVLAAACRHCKGRRL